MRIDETCATENNPWSIISSASTNSTLAGVLAAFLIAAIAVLFTKEHEAYVQTMLLFASAIVILALDSYLFSHITGIQPAVLLGDGELPADDTYLHACARAWTQAMPASGMLATGGVALTAGLSWMLAIHGSTSRPIQPGLATLGGVLTGVVIATTTLLLTITTIQYLHLLYREDVNNWVMAPIWLGVVAAIAYCVSKITSRTLKIRQALRDAVEEAAREEAAREKAAREQAAREQATRGWVTRKWVALKGPRVEADGAVPEGSEVLATTFALDLGKLRATTVSIAVLAFLGPLFAGVLPLVSDTWAAEPTGWIVWIVTSLALLTGLFLPIFISILISHSVPNAS